MPDKPKIFVGTPCYNGAYAAGYVIGLMALGRRAVKGEFDLVYPPHIGDSLVTRARNGVLHTFLQTDCTHLMWIDDDITFTPDDVLSLVNSGYDFTCGAYPKKDQTKINDPSKMDYVVSRTFDKEVDANGWQSVSICGTGFMCWTRKVADTLLEQAKLLPYKHGSAEDKFEYRIFHNDIGPGLVYMSEDYWVCWEWLKTSGKIWCNPNIKLSHAGFATWHGDYSQVYHG